MVPLVPGGLPVAPAFSPCGAIVEHMTRCYDAPVRWYKSGPIGWIRYYWVPDTNHYLKHTNVFWPYSQKAQIRNDDTGEQVVEGRQQRRYYNGANPYPQLDGSHICGTPQDFLGESPLPAGWENGTPWSSLPECVRSIRPSGVSPIGGGGAGTRGRPQRSFQPASVGSGSGLAAEIVRQLQRDRIGGGDTGAIAEVIRELTRDRIGGGDAGLVADVVRQLTRDRVGGGDTGVVAEIERLLTRDQIGGGDAGLEDMSEEE